LHRVGRGKGNEVVERGKLGRESENDKRRLRQKERKICELIANGTITSGKMTGTTPASGGRNTMKGTNSLRTALNQGQREENEVKKLRH